MNKNDSGLTELLELLKAHPELIRDLVFDATQINRLLKSRSARALALGQEATAFLKYLGEPRDGYAMSQCRGGTKSLCAKGTLTAVTGCLRGTVPL